MIFRIVWMMALVGLLAGCSSWVWSRAEGQLENRTDEKHQSIGACCADVPRKPENSYEDQRGDRTK